MLCVSPGKKESRISRQPLSTAFASLTPKEAIYIDDPLIADQHDWSIDNIVRWVRDELEGDVLLHIEDFTTISKEKNWRQGTTLMQEPNLTQHHGRMLATGESWRE